MTSVGMMAAAGKHLAPAWTGAAWGAGGTQLQQSTAAPAVDVPDGVVAGSIVVIGMFTDQAAARINSLPAGFEHAPDSPVDVAQPTGGGKHRLNVLWKRASGAESSAGTYALGLSASTYCNARCECYSGAVATGDPWDVTAFAAQAAADIGQSATPAVSDTTTDLNDLLVWFGTNWAGGSWTPPSGFTERRDSGDGVMTCADKQQAAAGATGSISGTATGGGHTGAWLGALKPAGATPVLGVWSGATPGAIADPTVYEMGTQFQINNPLSIVGCRIWNPGSQARTGRSVKLWLTDSLYDNDSATKVKEVTLPDTMPYGWSTWTWPTPQVVASTPAFYVVSYDVGNGSPDYGAISHGLDAPITTPDGKVSIPYNGGRFDGTPDIKPPVASFNNTFYGVDLRYQ